MSYYLQNNLTQYALTFSYAKTYPKAIENLLWIINIITKFPRPHYSINRKL